MLSDIDEECNGLGCNRTDFVIEAVQEKLQGKTEDQEEPKRIDNSNKPKKPLRIYLNDEPESIVEDVPELRNARIVLEQEPKPTLTLIEKPSVRWIAEPKPIFEEKPPNIPAIMRYIDGQWRPHATRYST